MLYTLARPLLFSLQPDTAHRLSLWGMRHFGGLLPTTHLVEDKPIEVMGLRFPNRIGLSAGLDKHGIAIDGLASFGFGFIEVGTITPHANPGNPYPRMFRFPAQHALISRTGSDNPGIEQAVINLQQARYKGILGVSIGKDESTPAERTLDDLLLCFEKVHKLASYVTLHVPVPEPKETESAGDTPFDHMLARLKQDQTRLADRDGRYVPLTLKVRADANEAQLGFLADILLRHQIDGVIATGMTTDHAAVANEPHGKEKGGLSGGPLCTRSTAIVRSLAQKLAGEIPIIASGGVTTGPQAREKIEAGASLVQIYTGFIYRGPRLIRECVEAIKGM